MSLATHTSSIRGNVFRLFVNYIDELFETKYNKNGRYIKFIYNGYKLNEYSEMLSEFSCFALIDTTTQEISLTNNYAKIKAFLSLSSEELDNIKIDLNKLHDESKLCGVAECMITILKMMLLMH